jgi:DNA-binding GntR family transcriptional regulator
MAKIKSIAEQAYKAILMDVLTCELDPGSQIAQSQLMERYAFGVTPVREALKRLESEGFVRTIPRFGYIITPITVKDVEDIYEMRSVLELASVRLAIQRAGDSQIAELEKYAALTYIYKDHESYQRFLEQNNAFHYSIAISGGNRKLADTLLNLLNQMIRIFNLGLDLRDSAEEMQHEHIALIKAVQARDTGLAEKIILDQINRSRQRVLQMISQKLEARSMSDADLMMH